MYILRSHIHFGELCIQNLLQHRWVLRIASSLKDNEDIHKVKIRRHKHVGDQNREHAGRHSAPSYRYISLVHSEQSKGCHGFHASSSFCEISYRKALADLHPLSQLHVRPTSPPAFRSSSRQPLPSLVEYLCCQPLFMWLLRLFDFKSSV
jgi:hypothetical protein